jgi:hypothetical protein
MKLYSGVIYRIGKESANKINMKELLRISVSILQSLVVYVCMYELSFTDMIVCSIVYSVLRFMFLAWFSNYQLF